MDTKNPWTKLSKERVYENNWIALDHHEVLNPSNGKGIYGTVHFKNLAIGIIPLDKEGFTYMVGQYRFPLNKYSWEIPEGGGQLDKDPLETAKRELLEEVGIKAKEWTEIQRIHTSNSVTDELGIIYLAEDLSYFEAQPDEDEQLEVQKIHWKDLYKMVIEGKITDSLSVAGVYKLALIKSGLEIS